MAGSHNSNLVGAILSKLSFAKFIDLVFQLMT